MTLIHMPAGSVRLTPGVFDARRRKNRDYLDSLAAVRDLDPTEVLPAHEWRFRGLADRVDSLTAHHEHRLTELLTAIAGAVTVSVTATDSDGLDALGSETVTVAV